MSKVHGGILRVRTPDGSDPPADLLQFAKKAMGALLENVHRQNLPSSTRTHRFPDGSVVTASWDGTTPTVTITPPHPLSSQTTVTFSPLWVPRGLIVYPAYSDAPFGVGLPIVADTDKDPYGPRNLAPGVDRQYWTPGGPCGEVLLTQDKDAGYPDKATLVCPLLYDDTYSPVFKWFGKGAYDSRATTSPWTAYRIEFSTPQQYYPEEAPASTLVLYQQVNTYRTANGQKAMYLPPRGYYDPAIVMASIMFTTGASTETSPGYPPPYDSTAQRLTKDGYSAFFLDGPRTTWARGDNPTGIELRSTAGGTSAVMGAWQSDATADSELLNDYGPGGFLNIGYRGGYWAADLNVRTSWIAAGNCYWQSGDQDIPPVSWYGFASVNLAWETYPATFDLHSSTVPLRPLYAFTDGYGNCWLNYPRSKTPYAADMEPAMSRHVYMRGRSIAMAPRGGLVWGACIQTFNKIDRLIALVHHPEDQPSDYTANGWTRYLRVWWCDIPKREHLRADPQEVICGEDATDTWGWKGGQLIDVGHMLPPSTGGHIADGVCSSLKYASQWKFNKTGTKAVCLRDYGLLDGYSSLYNVYGEATKTGLPARAVELQFNLTTTDTMTSVTFYDYTVGEVSTRRPAATPADCPDIAPSQHYEGGAWPIAVDYNAQDLLVYAFLAELDTNFGGDALYTYAGTGSSATAYASDLENRILVSITRPTADNKFAYTNAIVADVLTAAFVIEGVAPFFTDDHLYSFPCVPFTTNRVHGVRMWRQGALLDEAWYPAPDGVVFAPTIVCQAQSHGSPPLVYVWLTLAVSAFVQTYLAENMSGSVFSTQVAPLPLAATVLNAVPSDPQCGCLQTSWDVTANYHFMTYEELNPRGGHVIATVPLPSYDWLIYAKVV